MVSFQAHVPTLRYETQTADADHKIRGRFSNELRGLLVSLNGTEYHRRLCRCLFTKLAFSTALALKLFNSTHFEATGFRYHCYFSFIACTETTILGTFARH